MRWLEVVAIYAIVNHSQSLGSETIRDESPSQLVRHAKSQSYALVETKFLCDFLWLPRQPRSLFFEERVGRNLKYSMYVPHHGSDTQLLGSRHGVQIRKEVVRVNNVDRMFLEHIGERSLDQLMFHVSVRSYPQADSGIGVFAQ